MASRLADRILLLRWRLSGRAVTQPSCRACGYPIEGVESLKCPECGADRAVVGTIEPLAPVRVPSNVFLAAWWAVIVIVAWVSWPLTSELLPRRISYNEDYTLTPHSHLYGPFKIRRIGYGDGWKAIGPWRMHVDGATTWENPIEAFGGRFLTVMSINPRQLIGSAQSPQHFGSYAITRFDPRDQYNATPLPPQAGEFNGEFVLGWLGRMEIDTSRADVRAEADEIAALMLAPDFRPEVYQAINRFDVKRETNRSAASEPLAWSKPLLWLFGAAIGVAGWILLLRWRRRPQTA